MEKFKVICKADGGNWEIVDAPNWVYGPKKDEICVVYGTYESVGDVYYKLLGYPLNGYDSKFFIRLDELDEAAKEVVQEVYLQAN